MIVMNETSALHPPPYLSYQTGEHKDANEKVSHLKGNLKDRMGFVKTPDVDQTADSVVVTTQVPVERVGALEVLF